MAWVPLAASGLQYQFFKVLQDAPDPIPGLPDFVTFDAGTSILTLAQPGEPQDVDASWMVEFPELAGVRVRLTANSFLGHVLPEIPYYPANFVCQTADGGIAQVENSATAGGGEYIEAFMPAQFAMEASPAWVAYASLSFNSDGWVYLDRAWAFLIEVWVDSPGGTSYNCSCDDDYPRTTLAQMRNRLATRLGFATQVSMGILPPGMAPLLDDFIRNAQEMLYRRYSVFRMERFYTWNMEPGVRFYDFDANADACPKRMDPRMVTWVGISQGDLSWGPLVCGIDPVMYGSPGPGIPSHYEIRQCIEVWPPPVDSTWKLRIKGNFGLLPLEADSDETTIDPEAIFLQALANAKAHYSQPDAGNYAAQATAYVRSLVAGSHHTRRYVPGSAMPPPAVRPLMKED